MPRTFEVIGGHVVLVNATASREQQAEATEQRALNAGGQDPWQAASERSERIQRARRARALWVQDHS